MIEEKLNELTINYLSEEQYEKALSSGKINNNELYMTPDNDEMSNRNIITAKLTSNVNMSSTSRWTFKAVPLNSVFAKVGSKFSNSLSSNAVIIPTGVKYITACANLMLTPRVSTLIGLAISVNGSPISTVYYYSNANASGDRNDYISLSPSLIPVNAGDQITLSVYFNNANEEIIASSGTTMTIEAVG